MIYLYNTLLILSTIILFPILLLKIFSDKNLKVRFKDRFAIFDKNFIKLLKSNKIIWLHASSVGEVNITSLLIDTLHKRFPKHKLLITVMTVTGYETAVNSRKFDFVLALPFDISFIIKRFYKIVKPELILIAETEFWPNIFHYADIFNVPLIVFNCRISDKSANSYLKFKFFFNKILNKATFFLCQNNETSKRLKVIGVSNKKIKITQNIKFDVYFNIDAEKVYDELSVNFWKNSTIITAGSTHQGEEVILLNVFEKLKDEFPELRFIIAPRHPERKEEVIRLINNTRLKYKLLSQADSQDNSKFDVMIIDKIGYLVKCYSISKICFIGGSLILRGGHNPLEAVYFKKTVISGRNIFNFKDIYSLLEKNEGVIFVSSEYELEKELKKLLKNFDYAKRIADNAYNILKQNRGAIEKTVETVMAVYKKYKTKLK